MENRRLVLIALLGVVIFFIYQAWQDEQAAQRAARELSDAASVSAPGEIPASDAATDAGAVPLAGSTQSAVTADGASAVPAATTAAGSGGSITVTTDVLRVEISLDGGDLRRVELLDYELVKDGKDPVALLNDRDGYWFVLQSGLAGQQKPLATHLDRYSASAQEFRLGDGDVLEVPLTFQGEGYVATKVYRFSRGSYEIGLDNVLANQSAAPIVASSYARMQRTAKVVGKEPKFTHTFLGAGYYQQDGDKYKFQKISFKDLDDESVSLSQTGGWVSMLQHYFVAAIIPPSDEKLSVTIKAIGDRGYQSQIVGPAIEVAPGASHAYADRLYIGPKLQSGLAEQDEQSWFGRFFALDGLEHVAPGFELTVNYGILTVIAEPLYWLLEKLHDVIGNWGFAIIALTLIVKGAFYKLSEAQYRSMAKMRKFAPRIQELKERYEGDRERQSKAMMELYKKEGFNPLAGCWPLLVQMPVFFALYWVLQESVELRQADFALWIHDLSSPDPFFVLPVLFGASMWFQQKLSGQTATMDPAQARIMQIMPIAMGGFFAFFPAGLVLYWVVSNGIGILQQWYITRKLEGEGLGRNATA